MQTLWRVMQSPFIIYSLSIPSMSSLITHHRRPTLKPYLILHDLLFSFFVFAFPPYVWVTFPQLFNPANSIFQDLLCEPPSLRSTLQWLGRLITPYWTMYLPHCMQLYIYVSTSFSMDFSMADLNLFFLHSTPKCSLN